MADQTGDHMLVHEVEERLGVGESLVRKLFDRGELEGYRLPGRGDRRITRESVERVYQEMRRGRAQDD